jgi:DeoR/GlpR family transcriptional regulator of sugar metabolism
MDSGTPICAMAEAFRDHPITPVTIVTSNLPVGEMLAAIPDVQVFMVAGQLLHLQSTLLGEMAQRSLEFWKFDTAFLSAEAMNPAGIWNSQAAIVDQQRVVLERSARTVFCIDGSKLNREAPHFLVPWERVDALVTDVSDDRLATAGISLRKGQRADFFAVQAGEQSTDVILADFVHGKRAPVATWLAGRMHRCRAKGGSDG